MHFSKLLFAAFLLLATGTAQAQYSYLMDSLVSYKYSDTGLVVTSSTIYTHQEKDSLLEAHVYYVNSSGDRSLYSHTRYHYDGVHRMWLNKTYRTWNAIDSSWRNQDYSDRVFGPHGLSIESLHAWNPTGQVWDVTVKDSLFYDGNGRLQSRIFYSLKSDTLRPSLLLQYVYGAGNHLDTLIRYSFVSGQWKQNRRNEFHPDGNGIDTLETQVTYNTTDGSVGAQVRSRYMLNQTGDHVVREFLTYDLLKGEWKLNSRWEHELDPNIPINQLQIQEEIQVPFNFPSAPIYGDYYSIQTGSFAKFARYEYFKHQVKPNALKAIFSQDLSVYPNPCTNMITVPKSDFPLAESVQIYTMQGVKVSQHLLDPTGQIALNELNEGIYFLRVLDKEGRVLGNVKVIKQ